MKESWPVKTYETTGAGTYLGFIKKVLGWKILLHDLDRSEPGQICIESRVTVLDYGQGSKLGTEKRAGELSEKERAHHRRIILRRQDFCGKAG